MLVQFLEWNVSWIFKASEGRVPCSNYHRHQLPGSPICPKIFAFFSYFFHVQVSARPDIPRTKAHGSRLPQRLAWFFCGDAGQMQRGCWAQWLHILVPMICQCQKGLQPVYLIFFFLRQTSIYLSIYLSIYIYIYYIYIYISTSIRHGLLSQFHQNFSHIYIYISTSIYLHLYILIFIYIYFYLSLSIHPAIDLHSDCKIALATFTPTSTATISRPVPNSWPWIHSMAWMIRWMQKWQLSTHVHRNTLW